LFLEDVATKCNMDPLHPHTWRRLSATDIILEGGKTILEYFKGYSHAIRNLFPEIDLSIDASAIRIDATARRKLFENYAKIHGFDPEIPENWYQQPKEKILSFAGARSVLRHYKDSIPKALVNIFPDIGLDRAKFTGDTHRQRVFFENYAKGKGFDFKIPDNWYRETTQEIMSTKGALGILHNCSIPNVLCSVFPDIGLDSHSFRVHRLQAKQRQVFEAFARQHRFDPYCAHHWHRLSREQFMSIRGIHPILQQYKNSTAEALLNLFPSIGLERSKLLKRNRQRTSLVRSLTPPNHG
jgi:hypothetical protein